jgi:Dockerin type I domain/FG-GAP repeat
MRKKSVSKSGIFRVRALHGFALCSVGIGRATLSFIPMSSGHAGIPFLTAPEYAAGVEPQAVVVGDFNRDGNLDLAVANYGGNNISVLLGKADGGSVATSTIDRNDPHNYIVNLTDVTNAQVITVGVSNVTDSVGNFSSTVSASMGILAGDTNGDSVVNSADISQTKSQSGEAVTAANCREDVNIDGFINSADVSLVKSRSGTALP